MLCSSINIQKSSEALSPATENSAIGVPGALVQTCMVSRRNDQMRDDVEVRYFTWIISVYQRSLINELIPVGVGLSMWFFFPPYIQLRSIMQVAHTTITLLRQKKLYKPQFLLPPHSPVLPTTHFIPNSYISKKDLRFPVSPPRFTLDPLSKFLPFSLLVPAPFAFSHLF